MTENGGPGRCSSGSEVVLLEGDDGGSAAPAQVAGTPSITTMNIERSKNVHVGPKIVKVSNTIHNNEVIQGRWLGLELVAPTAHRRLRCCVAVFFATALLFGCGITLFFCFRAAPNKFRLDLDLNETWYLRRHDWQALPPSSTYVLHPLPLPVRMVVVGHSATKSCWQWRECVDLVRAIQRDHLERFDDIGPNFLVGGEEGYVLEGRGAGAVGAAMAGWNSRIISIMFLGDYTVASPTQLQLDHVARLLLALEEKGVLGPDYTVYGHCQIKTYTIPPGPNIMRRLHYFPHWSPENATYCLDLPCGQFTWQLIRNSTRAERLACACAGLVLFACAALAVYFAVFYNAPAPQDPDIAPAEWFITRDMWLARPYNQTPIDAAFEPLHLVVVQNTISAECHRFDNCAAQLRNLQNYFINDRDRDIPYNFLIGNDGRVYEGRGWRAEGAHTYRYNRCSVGLGFIGDYREGDYTKVTAAQENRTHLLLQEGVRLGYLHRDYLVVGGKDVTDTSSPGHFLYEAIRKWEHYDHLNRFKNKTCEEINMSVKDLQ